MKKSQNYLKDQQNKFQMNDGHFTIHNELIIIIK